jgi:Meiotically up-regulated gene 113
MPSESNFPSEALPPPRSGGPGGQELRCCLPAHGAEQLAFWTQLGEDLRPRCFVYVIQAEGDSPIKVGRAVDVPKRIRTLQTGNPRRLGLLRVMPGGVELEAQLHLRLRESRMQGEWFDGEQVVEFLTFAAELSQYMIDGWHRDGTVPSFRRFGDGWAIRRRGRRPTKVTYGDPDPEAVARAAERRRIEEGPREFRASERQKREFARAHSHPVFTPHKAA